MRPHGRARVNPGNPEAFAQCDRCGCWYNRSDLSWQFQWAGTHLYNLGILVCTPCLDTPQEQLRTIILPPDPPPVINARPPDFPFEEDGPVQAVLAETALAGSTQLTLQPANGTLDNASAFTVGQVVWVQLVDATSSANISFGQYQVQSIDTTNNILTVSDIQGLGNGISATAPVNGTVTVALTSVPTPP